MFERSLFAFLFVALFSWNLGVTMLVLAFRLLAKGSCNTLTTPGLALRIARDRTVEENR